MIFVKNFSFSYLFFFLQCVSFHPNGNYIASGSSDKTCRLWDIQSGQFVRVFVGHQVRSCFPSALCVFRKNLACRRPVCFLVI